MTQAEFVTKVAEINGISKTKTNEVLGTAFATLGELLAAGDQFAWRDLGSFKVVDRAAREGRNPQTGAKIQIPASKSVKFSAAQGLRDQING